MFQYLGNIEIRYIHYFIVGIFPRRAEGRAKAGTAAPRTVAGGLESARAQRMVRAADARRRERKGDRAGDGRGGNHSKIRRYPQTAAERRFFRPFVAYGRGRTIQKSGQSCIPRAGRS